jgi:uncharacterized membrane protein SpoIIM required for sporulation
MRFNLPFWHNASPKQKRIYSIVMVFLVAVLALMIGSLTTLSRSQAQYISDTLNQTLNENRANNTLIQHIFINNFIICLLMFIPLAGAGLGLYILYNTGVALSAIASIQGYSAYSGILNLVVTPIFWMEFAAYAIAMTQSVWLFRRMLQGRWGELKWTAVFIGVCALLLIVGAVVETWLITVVG